VRGVRPRRARIHAAAKLVPQNNPRANERHHLVGAFLGLELVPSETDAVDRDDVVLVNALESPGRQSRRRSRPTVRSLVRHGHRHLDARLETVWEAGQ